MTRTLLLLRFRLHCRLRMIIVPLLKQRRWTLTQAPECWQRLRSPRCLCADSRPGPLPGSFAGAHDCARNRRQVRHVHRSLCSVFPTTYPTNLRLLRIWRASTPCGLIGRRNKTFFQLKCLLSNNLSRIAVQVDQQVFPAVNGRGRRADSEQTDFFAKPNSAAALSKRTL